MNDKKIWIQATVVVCLLSDKCVGSLRALSIDWWWSLWIWNVSSEGLWLSCNSFIASYISVLAAQLGFSTTDLYRGQFRVLTFQFYIISYLTHWSAGFPILISEFGILNFRNLYFNHTSYVWSFSQWTCESTFSYSTFWVLWIKLYSVILYFIFYFSTY